MFEGDADAWHAWKLFTIGASKKTTRSAPLRDEILAPFQCFFATRLVRAFPVVVALYEKVKARHQAVDTVDLLLKLRDLLARDLKVRQHVQSLFDHVFVDEFQDTDPLQADVILFLCENGAVATRADDVELAPGKLTLVGDPKQSIYRFRRADIAMYESVRRKVAQGPHRAVRPTANFRSTPPLIEWFNDRFRELLGSPPPGADQVFSAATGEVLYQPLTRGRTDGQAVSIHVVPFEPGATKPSVSDYRALEAEVLARYLRWLVERSDIEVLDPITRKRRAVTYADVAVLAFETTSLPLLLPELDAAGVPYSARGGTLFLRDPLHRQFLLGLRAIADRDDGVAQAALHRRPFFALDIADVVTKTNLGGAVSQRFTEASALVRELRAERLSRSPGATARDLLERTAFGRTVALGPNGAQRLDRLRELCFAVEVMAAERGLDFDAVTVRLRDWVTSPVQLDAPHPVGNDAIQILTVHQAKGLEFPVVVLWDGRASVATRPQPRRWDVARDGSAWQVTIDRLSWEEPPGASLKATEARYCNAERRRLIYVAATRARDLLVVPQAGTPGQKEVAGMLLAGGHGPLSLELQTYRRTSLPGWARAIDLPQPSPLTQGDEDRDPKRAAWSLALAKSQSPMLRSKGVTATSHDAPSIAADPEVPSRARRPSRFGPIFGDTVHRAIGHALGLRALSPREAVERARCATGLSEHLEAAAADVERALGALEREGLTSNLCQAMHLEYPVVGRAGDDMLVGYIDLLLATTDGLVVVDFKTDASDSTSEPLEQVFPAYVKQLGSYARLLADLGLSTVGIRAGLLFTDVGALRWVSP